ncbi:hypothetical protein FA13DRAFT_1711852 [Coprinellus micaceus]|uniref:Uncharacterized protein n=1 Tax=Coprinellus micaceus TaxID=71717 RepID=A0A4Y7T3R3_COPMI|nr:hypothetical protein FA13DRAFT_1711852 [Coprinellus micaceus]
MDQAEWRTDAPVKNKDLFYHLRHVPPSPPPSCPSPTGEKSEEAFSEVDCDDRRITVEELQHLHYERGDVGIFFAWLYPDFLSSLVSCYLTFPLSLRTRNEAMRLPPPVPSPIHRREVGQGARRRHGGGGSREKLSEVEATTPRKRDSEAPTAARRVTRAGGAGPKEARVIIASEFAALSWAVMSNFRIASLSGGLATVHIVQNLKSTYLDSAAAQYHQLLLLQAPPTFERG